MATVLLRKPSGTGKKGDVIEVNARKAVRLVTTKAADYTDKPVTWRKPKTAKRSKK